MTLKTILIMSSFLGAFAIPQSFASNSYPHTIPQGIPPHIGPAMTGNVINRVPSAEKKVHSLCRMNQFYGKSKPSQRTPHSHHQNFYYRPYTAPNQYSEPTYEEPDVTSEEDSILDEPAPEIAPRLIVIPPDEEPDNQ